jgi:GTPase SAR1 family protein
VVDGSIVKIQYPVTFENETPTAINKLVVMSKKQAPRSTVWINEEGLAKIRERMAKLEKPDHDNKRGKSCWTVEYLAQQAYVSQSTIKRLLNKKVPIDQTSAISILDKLGFVSSSFIDEHDQMLKTYNQNQPLSSEVDWQKVCLEMLQEQQEDQQIRRKATEMGFEVKVYVPLGLVERKQQQRRSGIINTEQIHQLDQEVITQIYKYQEFLDDIIGQQPTDQDQHIAIIGEPGAGKTTLLDRIATYIKDKNQDLFICISLANLQGRPLKTYILKEWLPKAIALSYPEFDPESLEKTFQHRLNQGGVWLLLDGADEGKLSLPEIQTELSNFVKIRVVLTCRTNVWDTYVNNPLTRFKTYKTQEFKPEQIDQFIQGWFEQAKDEIRGKELQAKLKESQRDRIRQLVTNPLRLALLCQIFYKDKNAELPETKAGLYEQFVRYFYEWKPAITGIDWGTQPQLQDELHQGLGKLAITGLDSNYRYRLPLSLIKTEMDDRLFKLAWDLGWLTLVDREEKTDEAVYAFYHPTFQEYFAALAVEDWDFFLPRDHVDRPIPGKRYRIFEFIWREVIFLWLGCEDKDVNQKKQLIYELINFNDGCLDIYTYQAYFLGALTINEFAFDFEETEEIINTVINLSFDYYFHKNTEHISNLACITLCQIEHPLVSKILVNILNNYSDEELICLLAARLLGDIKKPNEQVINALLKIIYNGKNNSIKCLAAISLYKIDPGNPVATKTIVHFIKRTKRQDLRLTTAQELLTLEPDNLIAVKTILETIIKSENVDDSIKGITYLVNFSYLDDNVKKEIASFFCKNLKNSNKITFDFLIKYLLVNDKNNILKTYLKQYLLKIINANSETKIKIIALKKLYQFNLDKDLVIEKLINIIQNKNYDELDQCPAGELLLEIQNKNLIAIKFLFNVLQFSSENYIKGLAAWSLRTINLNHSLKPKIINLIEELLQNSEDELTNVLAASALITIDESNLLAIEILTGLIQKSSDHTIIQKVIHTFIEINCIKKDMLPILMDIVYKKENLLTYQMVIDYLINLSKYITEIKELWLTMIGDPKIDWDQFIIDAIGFIGKDDLRFMNVLLNFIDNSDDKEKIERAYKSLFIIVENQKFKQIIQIFKRKIEEEVSQENVLRFNSYYSILWYCSKNMSYPEFYQAWHEPNQETIKQLETQYNDLGKLLNPLQPTDQVYPILINGKDSLENLTDESAIAQELCNQIYEAIFPDDDIPTVKNAPELKRLFPKFKRQLNISTLVFIIYNIEPYPELINVCRQLLGKFHIAFITDQQIEPDLRGFPMQNNLVNILQNWLTEISYKETL